MANLMTSLLSHGLGKVKAMKARLSGLVGVFKTLAQQHGEITVLLELAKVSDNKFKELWPQIRRELLSHEKAEVREVFPVLRAYAATRALADRHDAEATELEQLIARVDKLAVDSPERRDVFQQLVDTGLKHTREEETEMFPKAQGVIGKQEAEALDARFLAAKRQIARSI